MNTKDKDVCCAKIIQNNNFAIMTVDGMENEIVFFHHFTQMNHHDFEEGLRPMRAFMLYTLSLLWDFRIDRCHGQLDDELVEVKRIDLNVTR